MLIRLLSVIIMLFFFSCGSDTGQDKAHSRPGRKDMETLNRYMVQKDRERIGNYIERKNLKMTELKSGLWYQVISEGEGPQFTDNSKIVFEYECSLLNGELCYTSARTGPKEIILGRSEIEAGLNQGLRLMKPGGRALFIIPPFLAYGLKGDGNKIPPRAVIVYNISVLSNVN